MASLRERKRDRTRSEFVVAALDLVESKGFADTTVDEIADRAMLSPATFFRYFGNKGEVFFPGLPEWLEVLRSTLATELAEHPPWEAVTHSIRVTTTGFVEQDPALAARLVRLWMTEPALRARYMEYADAWEKTIAQAVADSSGSDTATDAYAAAVAVAAIGAFRIAAEHFSSRNENFLAHFETALELMGNGLVAPPASPRRRA